jgi:DNA-directed RNA polymerase subunit RPC12/RpoP
MGLFNRNRADIQGQQPRDVLARAQQMQAEAMRQAAAFRGAASQASSHDQPAAEAGSPTWARQVLALIAPPPPGYAKRCSCAACGAQKKLPSVTAYVYCDYCSALVDFDLRRAGESDTRPSAEFAYGLNALTARARSAQAAGDVQAYRQVQVQVFDMYAANVPAAVSHRAKNDPGYRQAYARYMAEAAVAQAFDQQAQALEAELTRMTAGLRYGGSMSSPVIEPESFWPMTELVGRRNQYYRTLYRACGVTQLDPDRAEHLADKLAWSGFCQGWLGLLPPDAAGQLLATAGLTNQYVPVQAEKGQSRHCGGCGGEFVALPGATAIVCEGCGRRIDASSAEITCVRCGGTMTLPAGTDRVACPYCQSMVERVGLR